MKDMATSKSIVAGGTSAGQRQRGAVVQMQHYMTMLHGVEGWQLGDWSFREHGPTPIPILLTAAVGGCTAKIANGMLWPIAHALIL